MAWRFRRSIKILPGVKINIGKNSTSISVGTRGLHRTYSSTGRVTTSIGIPGTGLSYTSTSRMNQRSTVSENPERHVANNYVANNTTSVVRPRVDYNRLRQDILNIYRTSLEPINWRKVLVSDNGEYPQYFKQRAEKILNGDIDTYFEVLSDINPFNGLIQIGSEFECGSDDPRMIAVHFHVNSNGALEEARNESVMRYNDLLQDYVCGSTIRIARDIFALLPLRHVEIYAIDGDDEILTVDFQRRSFESLDFNTIDASDTVEMFPHNMNFSREVGFLPIG